MEDPKIQNDLNAVAEIKISYLPKFKAAQRPQINCAKDAYQIISKHWDQETIALQEEFKIMLLNRNNRVLGIYHLAKGGRSGVIVDGKLIFAAALKACANSIMLFHNHPSGNPKPSTDDLQITRRLIEAGKFLDCEILDHIILTPDNGYFSFADEGLI